MIRKMPLRSLRWSQKGNSLRLLVSADANISGSTCIPSRQTDRSPTESDRSRSVLSCKVCTTSETEKRGRDWCFHLSWKSQSYTFQFQNNQSVSSNCFKIVFPMKNVHYDALCDAGLWHYRNRLYRRDGTIETEIA